MTVYKKQVSVGAFLKKGVDFKDGDILKIADEGQAVEGQFGLQNIFKMKLADGKDGNLTINTTSLNNIIDGYGEDSKEWIGKSVKVWLIMQSVAGKMLKVTYLTHPLAQMVESDKGMEWEIPGRISSGAVTAPSNKKPMAERSADEIDPDEIPF